MLTGDGAFHQCYNAQAVVDEDHQVIVATDVNTNAADVGNLIPMTEQTAANTGRLPGQVLADAGYCSADNLDAATDYTDEHGTEFYVATGRHRRGDPPPVAPRGRIPNTAPKNSAWPANSTTKKGRKVYARRKAIVEPVFGQMHTLQNAKHLLLRGLDQARGEWLLLADLPQPTQTSRSHRRNRTGWPRGQLLNRPGGYLSRVHLRCPTCIQGGDTPVTVALSAR